MPPSASPPGTTTVPHDIQSFRRTHTAPCMLSAITVMASSTAGFMAFLTRTHIQWHTCCSLRWHTLATRILANTIPSQAGLTCHFLCTSASRSFRQRTLASATVTGDTRSAFHGSMLCCRECRCCQAGKCSSSEGDARFTKFPLWRRRRASLTAHSHRSYS